MRILITKPDALGDQIIVAGLIQQLNRQLPEAQIFWQVRAGMEVITSILEDTQLIYLEFSHYVEVEADQIFHANPKAIHIIPYDLNPLDDWTEKTWPRIWWWKDMLGAVDWDLVIAPSMNHNWFSGLTMRFSNAAKRIGFAKNASWQPLEDSLAITTRALSPSMTDQIPSSLAASEYEKMGELFSTATASSLDVAAIDLRPGLEWRPKEKRACILPGVGVQKKRAWPIEKWIQVSKWLEKLGWEIQWIEGPHDSEMFSDDASGLERLRFGADQLHALTLTMGEASILLCNDTSYTHIAAAIGVPTISIFGCGQGKRFFPKRGQVKPVQGITIEEHSQWHDFIDVWASVREIPVETVKLAIQEVVENQNFEPAYCYIDVSDTNTADAQADLRQKVFDRHLQMNWENWTRLQLLRESELKMKDLLDNENSKDHI